MSIRLNGEHFSAHRRKVIDKYVMPTVVAQEIDRAPSSEAYNGIWKKYVKSNGYESIILIPYRIGELDHWVLWAMTRGKTPTLTLFDPRAPTNKSKPILANYARKVARFLKKGGGFNVSETNFDRATLPKQTDGWSCGRRLIMNIEGLVKGYGFDYDNPTIGKTMRSLQTDMMKYNLGIDPKYTPPEEINKSLFGMAKSQFEQEAKKTTNARYKKKTKSTKDKRKLVRELIKRLRK